MNYPLRQAALEFLTGRIPAGAFKRRMDSLYENYPAPFAHVVWGGDILGKHGLLLAYRNDNGGLLLMRRSEKTGAYYMEHLYIDELVSPTNLAVDSRADVCRIYASCGRTQQVVRYTLTRA